MGKFLIAVCVLATSAAARAQKDKAAWQNLSALRPGQKIQVFDNNGVKHLGALASLNDQGITLQEKTGDHTIARADVREVGIAGHRARHVVIGLAVGAGGGAALGAAVGGCPSGNCIGLTRGESAGIFAVVGAVVGAIIGAVLPTHKTIYRARAP